MIKILLNYKDMKKSVLVFGLVLSTMVIASPRIEMDTVKTNNEDLPILLEKLNTKTDFLKVKAVQIQLKHQPNPLERKISLLKELNPIIAKLERKLRK